MYHWHIRYYGRNRVVRDVWVDGKTAFDAVNTLRENEPVYEVIVCNRTDKW